MTTTYRTCPRTGLQFEANAEKLMKANAFVAVVWLVAEGFAKLKVQRSAGIALATVAIVACMDGAPVWRHLSQPRLRVRNFSDAFLEDYLDAVGEAAFESVGCYQVEGRGALLFDRIEGDYFSILGMPLLPLLQWLRDRGTIPA